MVKIFCIQTSLDVEITPNSSNIPNRPSILKLYIYGCFFENGSQTKFRKNSIMGHPHKRSKPSISMMGHCHVPLPI